MTTNHIQITLKSNKNAYHLRTDIKLSNKLVCTLLAAMLSFPLLAYNIDLPRYEIENIEKVNRPTHLYEVIDDNHGSP